MKKYIVSILTEEYKVVVLVGSDKELTKETGKYGIANCEFDSNKHRGFTYYTLDSLNKDPLICISNRVKNRHAVLAHEAHHAVKHISDFVGINDEEFVSHGIAAIMRNVKL